MVAEDTGAAAAAATERGGGGFTKRNVVCLLILFFVNLVNYMDRYTVSSRLVDISEDICSPEEKCTSSQEGFLQTAFVIVYFVVAPVFGYLGDRYSRKYIMAAGVLVWGAISLSASFMNSYWPFLILRACIAIGESAFTTIAPTVLGDLFNEATRPIVLGIFYLAIPVGSGLGYAVGSGPADWHNGLRITPGLNVVGFILILVFMVDPPRGAVEEQNRTSYLEDIKYIAGVKSFLLNVAGFTCVTFTTGALSFWGPSYIQHGLRSCNETITDGCETRIGEDSVSFIFGAVISASGIAGVLSGMTLSKKLRPRFPKIDPVICGASLLLSVPLTITGMLMAKDDLVTAFVILFFGTTFLNMNWSISVDMSLYVILPRCRSSAEALHLMFTHAIGEAGSPYLIGVIADALIESECPVKADCPNFELTNYISLQHALYLAYALLALGGIFFLLSAICIIPEKEAVDRVLEAEWREAEEERRNINQESPQYSPNLS